MVENVGWDANLTPGQDLKMNFIARTSGSQPPSAHSTIESPCGSGGSGSGGGGSNTQPPATGGNPTTASSGSGGGGNPITPGTSSGGGK